MIRETTKYDLEQLLALYTHLHETRIPSDSENLRDTWTQIFVENVVTHTEYRGRGYATECLNYAKKIAMENGCYKMMLLTGSKEEKIFHFYENAGYNSTDKTAFIQWLQVKESEGTSDERCICCI